MFMSLAKLAQYQHCVMRRNGRRCRWSNSTGPDSSEPIAAVVANCLQAWKTAVDDEHEEE